MRGVNRRLLVMIAAALCLVVFGVQLASAQSGGVTVTPAALTLSLAPGNLTQTADFSITNHYDAPLALHFAFEPRAGIASKVDPNEYLQIQQADATVAPGQSLRQTVTMQDSLQLGPGSQLADLVVTQTTAPGGNIGVLPSIRMPLVLVKQDGAVTAISLAGFATPYVRFTTPGTLGVTIHNSGNMVAIPHGVVTVTDPNGSVTSRGVLNTASQAISPGGDLALTAPMTKLGNAIWPGVYRTTVSYGLGGGQATRTASNWYFYVAWWHITLLVATAGTVTFCLKHTWRIRPSLVTLRHAFKKRILGGDTP